MKNNLKELRKCKGYTLTKLADLSMVSKSRISELENSNSVPLIDTAYAIAKVLGIMVQDIWPDTTKFVSEYIGGANIKEIQVLKKTQ